MVDACRHSWTYGHTYCANCGALDPESWFASTPRGKREQALRAAAPDLLDALRTLAFHTKAETPEAIAAFDQAERAIAKAGQP